MRFRLRITPAASLDADEIVEFILRDSPGQAFRFLDALEATLLHIVKRPNAWRPLMPLGVPRADGLRYRPVLGFPNHVVLFRVVGECVDVVRVLHAARDIPAALAEQLRRDDAD